MPSHNARATPDEWRAAYEAKIADLARETLRTSTLSAALRRLYMGYCGAAKDAGYLPHQIRRYFVSGFPPDEREAVLAALPDDERQWVLDA